MITAIHLENFKAYGKRTTIPIRPLTFLCGPNNGGKSSITQAIAIAAEILNEGHFDGHRLKLDGGHRDFGGMVDLCHGRTTQNTPIVEFDLDVDGEISPGDYEIDQESRQWLEGVAERIERVQIRINILEAEVDILVDDLPVARFQRRTRERAGYFALTIDQIPGMFTPDDEETALRAGLKFLLRRFDLPPTVNRPTESTVDKTVDGSGLLKIKINKEIARLQEIGRTLKNADAGVPKQVVDHVLTYLSEAGNRWLLRFAQVDKTRFSVDDSANIFVDMVAEEQEIFAEEVEIPSIGDLGGIDVLFRNLLSGDWAFRGEQPLPLPVDMERLDRLEIGFERGRFSDGAWSDDEATDDAGRLVLGAIGINGAPLRVDYAEGRRLAVAIIDLFVTAPCRELLGFIGQGVLVGPVRSVLSGPVPPRDSTSWFDGSRAWTDLLDRRWDLSPFDGDLQTSPAIGHGVDQLRAEVNRHLGPDFLDTGMELTIIRSFPTEPLARQDLLGDDRFAIHADHIYVLKSDPAIDDSENLLQRLNTLPNVGAGVSQVFPCLVALQHAYGQLVAIEQPEVHLNPRQAVAFGDALVDVVVDTQSRRKSLEAVVGYVPGRSFNGAILVETHSEGMILRILRGIRESGGREGSVAAALVDKVQALFVDTRNADDPVLVLEVDEAGEWTSPWPDDFFHIVEDERY